METKVTTFNQDLTAELVEKRRGIWLILKKQSQSVGAQTNVRVFTIRDYKNGPLVRNRKNKATQSQFIRLAAEGAESIGDSGT
jgi:hypothetical protein